MLRMLFRTYRSVSAFRYYSTAFSINTSTIYAVSSGQGKCGVAIVRVSGTGASTALMELAKWRKYPKARYAHLKLIRSQVTKEVIDRGMVLWFPGPRSFTGEDVCEFHVHGGPAVISALLEALSHFPNFRMARPGEFSKRAFQNGKMDLVEVEGLADLIHAETEYQRQQAFLQVQGNLSQVYNDWRENLCGLLARFETMFNFDFGEYDDGDTLTQIGSEVKLIVKDIVKRLNEGKCGEKIRTGVDVVIAGEPNVGKSSLYNALCQKSAAIVTPYPGTTRDILDTHMDIAGYPVVLYDTCGIHMDPNVHPVEAQGITGARKAVSNAQLLILMIDAKKFDTWRDKNKTQPITAYIERYLHKLQMTELVDPQKYIIREFFKKPCLVVFNKCDQLNKPLDEIDFEGAVPISVTENLGMKELVKKLTAQVKSLYSVPNVEHPIITKARQRALLEACCEKLKYFVEEAVDEDEEEGIHRDYAILGNFLRDAIKDMLEIVEGKVRNDPVYDVLDDIFVNFCIGK